MLDGLVSRFEQRVAKGAKFHTVLHHLRSAKESLDQRMNFAADVMERVATETAVPFDISPAEQPTEAGETPCDLCNGTGFPGTTERNCPQCSEGSGA